MGFSTYAQPQHHQLSTNHICRRLIESLVDSYGFTEGGNFDIGHAGTSKGDVNIISGCSLPMVLRSEKDSYGLVGVSYGKKLLNPIELYLTS